jgi:hypothetical protein
VLTRRYLCDLNPVGVGQHGTLYPLLETIQYVGCLLVDAFCARCALLDSLAHDALSRRIGATDDVPSSWLAPSHPAADSGLGRHSRAAVGGIFKHRNNCSRRDDCSWVRVVGFGGIELTRTLKAGSCSYRGTLRDVTATFAARQPARISTDPRLTSILLRNDEQWTVARQNTSRAMHVMRKCCFWRK